MLNTPVVAHSHEPGYTQITEYNKMLIQTGEGSNYAEKYPFSNKEGEAKEPYYSVLNIQGLPDRVPVPFFCIRLEDFKYYNKD